MREELAALTICILVYSGASAEPTYVWVEAESGTDKVEHSNVWYDPVDRTTSLSGHDWWHSFDEPSMSSGYVVCPFDIPVAATYRLWLRLNTTSTGYRYALDDAEPVELPVKRWQQADRDNRENLDHERRIFDTTYASHDGSNRHKLVWVKGPEVKLAAGTHRLRIAVKPGQDNKGFAAVDCFVLAQEGFTRYRSYESSWDLRAEAMNWYAMIERMPDSREKDHLRYLTIAWYEMGTIEESRGRTDAAKALYRKALQLKGGHLSYRVRARDAIESIEYFE
jgi:hypothetical protein